MIVAPGLLNRGLMRFSAAPSTADHPSASSSSSTPPASAPSSTPPAIGSASSLTSRPGLMADSEAASKLAELLTPGEKDVLAPGRLLEIAQSLTKQLMQTQQGDDADGGGLLEESKQRMQVDEDHSTTASQPAAQEESDLLGDLWIPSIVLDRGKPFLSMRRRRDRLVKLVPVEEQASAERCTDGSIVMRDEATLSDGLHARCPTLSRAVWAAWEIVGILFVNGIWLPVFPVTAPFAILAFTNTSAALFGAVPGRTNNSSGGNITTSNNSLLEQALFSSAPQTPPVELPWPVEWEQACLILVGLWLGFLLYFWTCVLVLASMPSMVRRQLILHWPVLAIKLLISWTYLVLAIIIVPNGMHALWLIWLKGVHPLVSFFTDAFAVGINQRMHPERFRRLIGKDGKNGKKRNSTITNLFIFNLFLLIVFDIFRHYLVINFGQSFELIRIDNPFSSDKKSLVWDSRELASALYWGSTIFSIENIWAQWSRKAWRETTVNMAYYSIHAGSSRRTTAASNGLVSLPDWKSQRFE